MLYLKKEKERERGKRAKLGRAVMKIKESRYWNGLSLSHQKESE